MRWLLLALLFPALACADELEIAYGGSHPPQPEVVALVRSYMPHLIMWSTPADRDRKRAPMVVPGYFYHDMNGSPVAFDALTKRHTRNELMLLERRLYDVVLHQLGAP